MAGFLAPLIPLGAKLLGIGKTALATGKAAMAAKGATQLAIPGMGMAAKSMGPRMAGDALFKSGIGNAIFGEMSKGQIASRLAPDAIFGGLAALQTPGDIGDKLVAGGASLVGGGLGGLALSRAAGARGMGEGVQLAADFGGSILGDMGGMAVGDAVMRGKDKLMGGAGQTPYERMSTEQQAQFAEEIRRQTLSTAGLVPGVRDQFMYENGLG